MRNIAKTEFIDANLQMIIDRFESGKSSASIMRMLNNLDSKPDSVTVTHQNVVDRRRVWQENKKKAKPLSFNSLLASAWTKNGLKELAA